MSRRPLRRLTPEQETIRRLKHMAPGGLLQSERPVRRAEGSTRPPRVGGGGAAGLILRPDTITDYDDQPVSYQGGGGQSTLQDQSDATFLRLDYILTPSADFLGTPVATFAARACGWASVDYVTLTVRARSLSNPGGNAIAWNLAGNIPATYSPYYSDDAYMAAPWVPGASWANYSFGWDNTYDPLPSPAAIAAGAIQLFVGPSITTTDEMQLDIADVWLTVTGA